MIQPKKVPVLFLVTVALMLPMITPVVAYTQVEVLPSHTVLVGTEVTLIAKTDNNNVKRVVFEWIDPDGDLRQTTDNQTRDEVNGEFQFKDSFVVDEVGDWEVWATFYEETTSWKEVASVTVFLTVIPEVPLGTMMAMIASFAALAALATRKHL